MNPETLRKIFKSPFDYKTYSNEIVHRLFGCNDVATMPELLDTNATGDKSHYIGQMEDADGRLLGFFYTRVADGGDVRRKRVGLRKLIQPYLKYDVDGAIAVFDDGNHWRLSYICDLKEGNTAAKRFSYILGDEQGQYKTPLERLGKVAEKNGRFKLSDLKDAFSVDALSKEFFDEYHRHYDRICDYIIHSHINTLTHLHIHDYVKKMMGRIVFLHFLQKKRWLDDDPEFLKNLFFMQPLDRRADFLEQLLEPLFFGIFNTEKANREQLFKTKGWNMGLLEDWKELPYLNGGLFERDAVDEQNITLPASLFEDLFTFMASYNFTVDENDPDDAEVGVDPEMLGKIFESLLEDNKAKGAFYTPKEIVRYMCKESLIAYLATQIDKSQSEGKEKSDSSDCDKYIRAFVETHEMQPELEPYREALDTALREVKICDPAIGSGAFPMGLLNELWRCREAIEETSSRVELKKEIIENNIYGVDIEKGAIDIARLRFWLSIVVDAEEPEPLPNFDYKFMQGNSLIESFEGFDLSRISSRLRGGQSKSMQLVLGIDSHTSRQNLQRLLREYFSVTDHKQKSSMRQAINEEVKTLIRESVGGTPTSLAKLEMMDCSANQDFFLWHTWFKDIFDKGGFDIVIGNPPYVARLCEEYKQSLGKIYPEAKKKIFDLYNFFMVCSLRILSPYSGVSTMIVPPTWLNNKNSNKLRKTMATRGLYQIDYLDENVFENAIVYSCIFFTNNSKNERIQCNKTRIENGEILSELRNSVLLSVVKKDGSTIPLDKSYGLVERIKNTIKIELLGDISNIVFGIQDRKSAQDPSYIHTENHGSYKKVLNGKHIGRYFIQDSGLFIDYGPWLWNPRKKEIFECAEKILIRQVGKYPICAYDNEQYYTLNTIYNVIVTDKLFNTKYIIALLNAKIMQSIWKEIYPEQKDVFPRLKKEQLVEIPIPIISIEQQKQIADIVDQILFEKKANPNTDTSILEYEIDKLVYQLYNLTPEEIAIIEQ